MSQHGKLTMNLLFDPNMRQEILDLLRSQARAVCKEHGFAVVAEAAKVASQAITEEKILKAIREEVVNAFVNWNKATPYLNEFKDNVVKTLLDLTATTVNMRFDEYMKNPERSKLFEDAIASAVRHHARRTLEKDFSDTVQSAVRHELKKLL